MQIVFELHAPVVTLGDRAGMADDLAAPGLLGAAQMLIDADQKRIGERSRKCARR
ncbi:MAG: hypothetical protein WBE48_01960 [Xanthobacteraceae bacterium]